MNAIRKQNRGFTLVEILIVVIILGILAAIVIPQFTNASEDARKSSVASQLQSLRSQVELYKLQHHDKYPTDTGLVGGAWDWTKLTGKTDDTGATSTAADAVGPYMPTPLTNPLTNSEEIVTTAAKGKGWIVNVDGKLFASGRDNTYFDETTAKESATEPGTVAP